VPMPTGFSVLIQPQTCAFHQCKQDREPRICPKRHEPANPPPRRRVVRAARLVQPQLPLSEGEIVNTNKVNYIPKATTHSPYLWSKCGQKHRVLQRKFLAKKPFALDIPPPPPPRTAKWAMPELQIGDSRIMLAEENPSMGQAT